MTSSNKKLLTSEYEAQLVEKHRIKPWGGGGASWIPEVVRLMIRFQLRATEPISRAPSEAPRILDYGAGRHTFCDTMLWLMPHVDVTEYDPGVPGIDSWPPIGYYPKQKYDLTVCTDVMEHVEEQFVDETLQRIADVTRFAVLFNIALTPSKSLLPNGQNAHVTVKPALWWTERLGKVFRELEHVPYQKGLTLVAHK